MKTILLVLALVLGGCSAPVVSAPQGSTPLEDAGQDAGQDVGDDASAPLSCVEMCMLIGQQNERCKDADAGFVCADFSYTACVNGCSLP